jgi:predicted dehydrogenase
MNKLLHLLPRVAKGVGRRIARGWRRPSEPARLVGPVQPIPRLRCGVVGFGAMGRVHAEVLRGHPYFQLVGVTSTTPRPEAAEALGCRWFDSAEQMLGNGEIDVTVIATPHWDHAPTTLTALRVGLHVVCDKPLTVSVTEADEVLAAAAESRGVLTCVSQSRFEPIFQKVKQLLADGELGQIVRCEMEESFWRSDAYYRSNPWRGTWKGEGGGVLINQGPHVLDRYLWLCGAPQQVTGFCDTALHPIEVEDVASAVFRHAGGRHGHLHVNTTECPQRSRLSISCARGRITVEGGTLRIDRLADSVASFTRTAEASFGDLPCESSREEIGLIQSPHVLLSRYYENFALAVAGQQPLGVPAEEARRAVELANAIQLSSALDAAVTLPLERARYTAWLQSRLQPESR